MSFIKHRKQMIAAGMAACQFFLCTPGAYAAENMFAIVPEDLTAVSAVEAGETDLAADVFDTDLYDDGEAEEIASDEAVTYGELDEDSFNVSATDTTAISINGSYFTKKTLDLLQEINTIREIAYVKHYEDKQGRTYGVDVQYEPLKWSLELEKAARTRAAEATVLPYSAKRPNGEPCATVLPQALQNGSIECRAFSEKNLSDALSVFKKQGNNYFKHNGSSYDDWKEIIDPRMKYVGLGCFKPKGDKYYSLVLILSSDSGLNEDKDTSAGSVWQRVELSGDKAKELVSNIKFTSTFKNMYVSGANESPRQRQIEAKATLALTKSNNVVFNKKTVKISKGLGWKSSDPGRATVDDEGVVTALSAGPVVISIAPPGTMSSNYPITVLAPIPASPTQVGVDYRATYKGNDNFGKIYINYDLSTVYKKKKGKAVAVTGKRLNVSVDATELLKVYGVEDPAVAAKIVKIKKYKFKNNKKAFTDTSANSNDSKRPYFYVQLKVDKTKAKKLGKMSSTNISKLKKMISSINTDLKKESNRCLFYINPAE